MAGTALFPLRKLQVGHEGTNGSATAATQQLVGRAVYEPQIDREFEEFPRGVITPYSDSGFDLRKGSLLTYEGNLTYEELLYPLQSGLLKDEAPGAGPPYLWEFDAVIGNLVNALTFEFVVEDGATKHFEQEFAFGVCRSFGITLAADEIAQMRAEWFGRAEQTSVMTTSLAPLRVPPAIPSNLFTLDIDDTWAGLGGTQIAVGVKRLSLDVVTGREPESTLDGRADLDLTGIKEGQVQATLTATLNHNADVATEFTKWRGSGGKGIPRFVRLAATDGNRILQIDMACKHMRAPTISDEEGQEVAEIELGLEYDPTGGAALEFTLTNDVATLP